MPDLIFVKLILAACSARGILGSMVSVTSEESALKQLLKIIQPLRIPTLIFLNGSEGPFGYPYQMHRRP